MKKWFLITAFFFCSPLFAQTIQEVVCNYQAINTWPGDNAIFATAYVMLSGYSLPEVAVAPAAPCTFYEGKPTGGDLIKLTKAKAQTYKAMELNGTLTQLPPEKQQAWAAFKTWYVAQARPPQNTPQKDTDYAGIIGLIAGAAVLLGAAWLALFKLLPKTVYVLRKAWLQAAADVKNKK